MNPNATSKANILKTSRELIQQNGWAGVSIRSVAAACGVSVGCIYNYFASKTELLSATVESIWSDIFHHPEDEVVFLRYLVLRPVDVSAAGGRLPAVSGLFYPTMRWALSGRILPTANSRCSVHGGTFWKPCVWCCRMIPRSGPTPSQRSLPLKSLRKHSSL